MSKMLSKGGEGREKGYIMAVGGMDAPTETA